MLWGWQVQLRQKTRQNINIAGHLIWAMVSVLKVQVLLPLPLLLSKRDVSSNSVIKKFR